MICPVCTQPNGGIETRAVGATTPTGNIRSCGKCFDVAVAERQKALGDAQVSGATTRRALVLAALTV